MIYDYIVIGAGQAGLAISYYLKQAGFQFLAVDNGAQIGASWLKRWDSLTLFTPSQFNHLPGMDFPMPYDYYPDKNEVAQYLEQYVKQFDLPVELNFEVNQLCRKEGIYQISSPAKTLQANNVIIATGPFHTPFIPALHKDISEDIWQIHSCDYKNPQQLKPGNALVVGAGDSGVQILQELSDSQRQVYLSGSSSASVLPQTFLGKTLWWWFTKTGFLSVNKYSWLGKKLSKIAQPIIGTDLKALLRKDNVKSVGRAIAANGNTITFEDTQLDDIRNIIWATGFKPDFGWIEDLALDDEGYPRNYRGIGEQKGLYFIGLPWMYTRGSATLGGVKDDAKFLFDYIAKQATQDTA